MMENYEPRMWDRRIKELDEDCRDDDECGGHDEQATDVKDGLLDLGVKQPISILVARRDHVQG